LKMVCILIVSDFSTGPSYSIAKRGHFDKMASGGSLSRPNGAIEYCNIFVIVAFPG